MKKNYTQEQAELLLNYLKTNKHKTISGGQLKDLFQLTTTQLQGMIHDLRIQRQPIISKGNLGYNYSTDKEEILKTYMSLMKRGMSIIHAAQGLFGIIDNGGEWRTDDV